MIPAGASALQDLVEVSRSLYQRGYTFGAGATLAEASALAEEVEGAARLFSLVGSRGQALSGDQVDKLRSRRT